MDINERKSSDAHVEHVDRQTSKISDLLPIPVLYPNTQQLTRRKDVKNADTIFVVN